MTFKNLFAAAFIGSVFIGCKANPDDLAKDYCNCRLEIEKGTKSEDDCKEMAESHTLQLQDEEGAFAKYSERVLDCVGNDEMTETK
jgi:hypothetical protein